ncbi:morphogenetic protein associated with SpoVID [Oceanobacillus limi]|uniref:Morphogenetic protein associated with SpoVID n=1 Tax=Oceanobacillus limi TaxID=930131 RepID=A0A1I0HIB8_9BACI|nr:SafA/ExsA family spore coat assembly protein [Oceanobacillus limi]SET82797.1 morphogenetic protein associated with SpoVID [Oceanobacillus limi]
MKIHIVQKGDTLWEIAKQYGVDFEEVKQLNSQLSSPDMIMPGMKVKIPTSAKTVKKEAPVKEQQIKEKQKPVTEKPYKDISPKPFPVIKEDDEKPAKEVKPEMPMPQMPQMPLQPMMQMPIMQQEIQQDIHLPKMPEQPKEKPVKKEQPKEQPIQQPVQQPVQQPMVQQPIHMVPCYPVPHPCYPVPIMHPCDQPMYHHQPAVLGPQFQDFESSSSPEFPIQQSMPLQQEMMPKSMHKNDCGCKGSNPMPAQAMGSMQAPYGFDQMQPPFQAQPMSPYPTQQYPQIPDFNQPAYPTPPGYPSFRQEEDESASE